MLPIRDSNCQNGERTKTATDFDSVFVKHKTPQNEN